MSKKVFVPRTTDPRETTMWQLSATDIGSWKKPLWLKNYAIWVDATGDLRIKSGAPTTDLDGTVVGSQS